ncbi:MAG: sterol desaturase family protein [Nitrosomonas sp.]|nr:sterol desaturase family protein [Nitrosomonas sp.]
MLVEQESYFRASLFLAVLMGMALWEIYAPKRQLTVAKWLRWRNNLSLTFINSILLKLLLPVTATGIAAYAASNQLGLFNQLTIPAWLAISLSIIVFDLAIYGQHVALHAFAPLWRLHRAHHADLDLDVTTGLRFHPLEMLFSMLFKLVIIVLIGAPVVSVLLFEIILNAMAMFNHGNIHLPGRVDHLLRYLIVTPDMHRVHHSVVSVEMNSNFGFNLTVWDRLFATYRDQPQAGHDQMTIGLSEWRNPQFCSQLMSILRMPFRNHFKRDGS